MSQEIQSFFSGYCAAYNRFDAAEIARHFALPSMLVDKNLVIWTTEDEISENMRRLLAVYRDGGYKHATYTIEGTMVQGDDNVVVNVSWHIERSDKAPWSFCTGYNLRRVNNGRWKIILCTAYDERRVRNRG